jgi:hypothetical protein
VAKKRVPDVIDQLREAIRNSGQSLYRLGKTSGVGPDRLSRFMRGERDLTGDAVAKICTALGLQLVGSRPPAKPKRRPPASDN